MSVAPPPASPSSPAPSPLSLVGASNVVGDKVFWGLCRAAAISFIVLAVVLFLYIVKEAWPAVTGLGWHFLVTPRWDPPEDFGALAFIYGTLWTSALAMLLAVPFGVATAAFLAEI